VSRIWTLILELGFFSDLFSLEDVQHYIFISFARKMRRHYEGHSGIRLFV
jgi:hypothetical protein